MKKYWLWLFVLILCLVQPTITLAQERLPSGISDTEMSQMIDAYIEEHEDTTAAVSVEVFRGDEVIYKNYYGLMNIEDELATTQDSVYEWGSISKLLVWVSVMQLWEDGQLDLDANIQTYLPRDFNDQLKYQQDITLTNLMNHNAGFEESIFQMTAQSESDLVPLDEILIITEPNQIYKPGEVVSYSNWSSALAGYIVEEVSGQNFYDYVQEHIFQPLGMDQTSIRPDHLDNRWVKEQLLSNNGYYSDLQAVNDGLFYLNMYPAGSTAGTIEDLRIFAQALIPATGGWRKLFDSEATLAEMLSPTLYYPDTEIDYINHGMWSSEYNVQTLGHGGNTNTYSTQLLIDPVSEVGMVIMTNQASETVYNYGLPPLIFGELGAMVADEERTDTSRMAGLYYSSRTIRNGIASMYTLTTLTPVFNLSDNRLGSNIFNLLSVSYDEIAPNTLVSTTQLGDIKLSTISRYSELNGQKKISTMGSEALEADYQVWLQVIFVLLFLIAVIVSLLILVSGLVRLIIRLFRKKKAKLSPLSKYPYLLAISIILQMFNILWVADRMSSIEALASSLYMNVFISVLLAIVPLIYTASLIRHWPLLKRKPWQKLAYSLLMILGLGMSLLVVALEMYYV